MFNIAVIQSTPIRTNNYLVDFDDGCILFEASASVDTIESMLNGRPLLAVFLTHSHFDHAVNLENIIKHFGVDCYLHPIAKRAVFDHKKSFYGDRPFSVKGCDEHLIELEDGKTYLQRVKAIFTPGHTDDSVCFVLDNLIFSGDTLFCDGYGRVDLYNSVAGLLGGSLKKLFNLPGDFEVLPGHGEKTTLQKEREVWEGAQ